jgi:uncharacterized protein YqiB (DUF1249 family)
MKWRYTDSVIYHFPSYYYLLTDDSITVEYKYNRNIAKLMIIKETEYKQDCIKRILRAKRWNLDEEIKWVGNIGYYCGYRLHIVEFADNTYCLSIQGNDNVFPGIDYKFLAEAKADAMNRLYDYLWNLI